jgi:hypothetical protein
MPLTTKHTSLNQLPNLSLGFSGRGRSSYDDETNELDENEKTFVREIRSPIPTRPHVAYQSSNSGGGGGTLPRVKFSALTNARSNKKKRKLVISGIAHGDTKKFEGVKKWCEVCYSFN